MLYVFNDFPQTSFGSIEMHKNTTVLFPEKISFPDNSLTKYHTRSDEKFMPSLIFRVAENFLR